jgi:TPR repeat protein
VAGEIQKDEAAAAESEADEASHSAFEHSAVSGAYSSASTDPRIPSSTANSKDGRSPTEVGNQENAEGLSVHPSRKALIAASLAVVSLLAICAALYWGLRMSPKEQFEQGLKYATGQGVQQDDVQAVSWFQKAADRGYAEAQSDLGEMYANGRGGLAKDDAQAVSWYQKAAAQGYTQANVAIADVYARQQQERKTLASARRETLQHFSVNGLTLGLSVSQVDNQMIALGWPALTCNTTGRGVQECLSGKVGDNTSGENVYGIDAWFLDGSLYRVQYAFPRPEFDSMFSAVRNTYGDESANYKHSTGQFVWDDSSGTFLLVLGREYLNNSSYVALIDERASVVSKLR